MAKDPAFLFYPGDWLCDTMTMTFEEKGAYLELFILQFNTGKFTEADAKHMLSTCNDDVWDKLKVKFKNVDDYYYSERLKEEIEKRKNYTLSRRNNALAKKKTKAHAEHMENEDENENKDINKDDNNVKKCSKIFKKVPPLLEDVKKRVNELGYSNTEEAEKFFNYYESNGWRVGRNPMKDWSAALTNWFKNLNKYGTRVQTGKPQGGVRAGDKKYKNGNIYN